MHETTCRECGVRFETTSATKCYCDRRCYSRANNRRYRSTTEAATCKRCDAEFQRTRGSTQTVYCSDECHVEAKRVRCVHGVTRNGTDCPACTFLTRAESSHGIGWRQVVKSDPCAYCGGEGGSVDHIDPTLEDRNDPSNWTGACVPCNNVKQQLRLPEALLWVPLARRYHDLRRTLFAS